VGPVWHEGQHHEDDFLTNCYRNSLALAEKHGIRTLAFPAISTGAYGFPLERAVKIAVRAARTFLEESKTVEKVIFVCFGTAAYKAYLSEVNSTGQ